MPKVELIFKNYILLYNAKLQEYFFWETLAVAAFSYKNKQEKQEAF